MAQIRINTEHAREVGRRLIAAGDRLAEIGHELQRAIGSLDTWAWDGVSRWRAEPLLSRVRPESAHVAEGLDALGRKLVRVADVFEQEDNTAARKLEGMPWVDFTLTASAISTLPATPTLTTIEGLKDTKKGEEKSFLDQVGEYLGYGEVVWEGGKIFPLAIGLLGVKYMSGFSGNVLKDAWTLGIRNLTRTARDLNGPLGISSLGLALGTVGEVVGEIGENWEQHKGDPFKFGTSIVVETSLGVGLTLLGGAVGTFVGCALLGAVLGPPGMVIGGKIGGVVGGYLGGKAADWEIIPSGEQKVAIDDLFVETVTEGIQTSVQVVDQALGLFVDSVAQLF